MAAIVAEHYARSGPADSVATVIAKLVDADLTIAEPVIRGLAKGWITNAKPKLDDGLEKALAKLASRLPTAQRGSVAKLASAWGSTQFQAGLTEISAALLAQVKNDKVDPKERVSAARELIAHAAADKDTAKAIIAVINPRTPPEAAKGLLSALQSSEVADVGEWIVDDMTALTPEVRSTAISVLLGKPAWTKIYLDRVEKGKLQLTELSLDQKQATDPRIRVRKSARSPWRFLRKAACCPTQIVKASLRACLTSPRSRATPLPANLCLPTFAPNAIPIPASAPPSALT